MKLFTTDAVGYVGACQAPSPVDIHHYFRPTMAVQEKCKEWLRTVPHPPDIIQISHGGGILLDSQLTLEVPELHEPLLSVSAINITMIRCSDAV
jgi:hypothetical protein